MLVIEVGGGTQETLQRASPLSQPRTLEDSGRPRAVATAATVGTLSVYHTCMGHPEPNPSPPGSPAKSLTGPSATLRNP